MKNQKLTTYFSFFCLFILLCIFLFLRTWNIFSFPQGLNQDEAVHGYDAYSLGLTGRDHYGQFLPIIFRSFDDWVEPLFTYFLVPFVKIFGLSVATIRLPVAVIGVFTVLLMGVIVRQLGYPTKWQLLGVGLIGLAGWHITLSRWAIPPAVLPFLCAGFLLVLLQWLVFSKKDQRRTFLLSAGVIFFAAALTYTYPTQRIFVPMILCLAGFLKWKAYRLQWRNIAAIMVGYFVVVAPFLWITTAQFKLYNQRFLDNFILSETEPVTRFIVQYFDYFSPHFLTGRGDIRIPHQVPGIPLFHPLLAVIGLVGFLRIMWVICEYLSERKTKQQPLALAFLLILGWVILAPIPAALTDDPMHVLRVIHMFPAFVLLIVIGTEYIFSQLYRSSKKWIPWIFLLAVWMLLGWGTTIFYKKYFGEYQQPLGLSFQSGLTEVFTQLPEIQECTSWVIDSQLNQPYIVHLFATKRQPDQTLYTQMQTKKLSAFGKTPKQIDQLEFRQLTEVDLLPATPLEKTIEGGVRYRLYKTPTGECLVDLP
jgi:hypothetical protein